MKIKIIALFILTALAFTAQVNYPMTKTVSQIDDYFGTKVPDPYRWLENDQSEETKAWVLEQNKVTFSYLEKIPYRSKIKQRLTELWNFEKASAPMKKGDNYFSFFNNGLQNQSVMVVQKSLMDKRETFLDMNTYAADGTASMSGFAFSNDNRYMAFGVSRAGSDWVEIHVMDVATRKELNDKVEWAKFTDISWQGNGFYYSRYDAPKANAYTQKNEYHKIYYHKVGTPQSADQLVYEDKKHPDWNFYASVSDDEHFIFVGVSESTSGQRLLVKDLKNGGDWITLSDNFENEYGVVDNVGDEIFIRTNWKAPNYRLMKFNISKPQKENWTDVIAEQKDVLEGVHFMGDKLVAQYLKDVSSRLYVYDYNGKQLKEIKFDGLVTVSDWHSSKKEKNAFYTVVCF